MPIKIKYNRSGYVHHAECILHCTGNIFKMSQILHTRLLEMGIKYYREGMTLRPKDQVIDGPWLLSHPQNYSTMAVYFQFLC